MNGFGRVAFDFVEVHQPHLVNNLLVKAHLRVDTLPDCSARCPDLEKQLHSVKRWLHELVDEQQATYLNSQPRFFGKLTNERIRSRLGKLQPSARWTPERIGRANTPVAHHQQAVAVTIQTTHAKPQPVAIQFQHLLSGQINVGCLYNLRHGK